MNKRRLNKALKRVVKLPRNKYLFLYVYNKLKNSYYKLKKSTKVAYPSTIMLELTNHCNLACTTCPREYEYGKAMDKGQMNIDQAKRVIDELWPYLDSIGLTGLGETFLYKELENVVDYIKAKNQGIIISVSTNAILPNFIEKVSPLVDKIDTIQVSIDGLGSVYESIRINASFQELDKNLRILSEMCRNTKTDLMLNMVVTKENFHQMPLLVEYAEEVGINYMDFTLFNLASVTNIERSYYQFYQSPEFLEVISKLEETISKTSNVVVTNKNFKTDNCFQKCPFPWNHFYICWNGFIPPCCGKSFPKELNFGNVFNSNVMDVLNSDSYRSFRTMWLNNKTPKFCYKCHFIDLEPIKENC
ncbi:radical SAM protein [uncultured Bacteroides sp.]|uniref:radical SAM/SPASM domain-containing protein n=1 Tax=uncultured Bacteroides sp. TaxID=162156 RepID=UPI002AAC03F8|nr:radical SAM protein [uncultured Bacteroides sp.]